MQQDDRSHDRARCGSQTRHRFKVRGARTMTTESYCLQVSTCDGVLTLQTMPNEKEIFVVFTHDTPRKNRIETAIPYDQFRKLAESVLETK
jgi:hypothetical protein